MAHILGSLIRVYFCCLPQTSAVILCTINSSGIISSPSPPVPCFLPWRLCFSLLANFLHSAAPDDIISTRSQSMEMDWPGCAKYHGIGCTRPCDIFIMLIFFFGVAEGSTRPSFEKQFHFALHFVYPMFRKWIWFWYTVAFHFEIDLQFKFHFNYKVKRNINFKFISNFK